ncbi:MAG TPA: hypothetical protein DGG94_06350 [Micromonosporaceae bacterium]|nr:hypothetical protein [Micromonosporaceae bacterium]HCU49414.1 hypothetical protein [Micromonosporaceae bacterium]
MKGVSRTANPQFSAHIEVFKWTEGGRIRTGFTLVGGPYGRSGHPISTTPLYGAVIRWATPLVLLGTIRWPLASTNERSSFDDPAVPAEVLTGDQRRRSAEVLPDLDAALRRAVSGTLRRPNNRPIEMID